MKAFSRIPDHFEQHLENLQFNFPFKMVIQIDAIPQGKYHSNVNHIVKNPNQHKHRILSLDINDQFKDEMGKESQNTAITEGNLTSKELEEKQKLVAVKKCTSEAGQKVGNFNSCEDQNIGLGSEKMMQVSFVKRLQISQQQKLCNSPIDSDTKLQVFPIVSHIVFSSKQQQIVKGTFHKRSIFSKGKQLSSVQKNCIEQQKFQEQIVNIRIEQKLKQTQSMPRFMEKESKVEEFIQRSFSNNSIFKKEGQNDMKDTGFDLIESVLSIFKNEPMRPKAMSLLDEKTRKEKQYPGHIDLNLINKKENLRNLRGKKPIGSRAFQQSSLQPVKLQLIQSITINPVFF